MLIGRVNELAGLMKGYRNEGFSLFELYGAANAGKTALLEEFCHNKDAIFFTASHESGRANLIAFSKLVLSHYKEDTQNPFMFWNDAFRYITEKGGKVIVVLDNFDELTDRDPVFIDMLAKCIAETLKDSKVFLVLSGRKKILAGRNELLLRKLTSSLELEKFTLTDDVAEQLRRQTAGSSRDAEGAKMFRVKEEDVILREGEVNSEMYKIVSGRAVCCLGYGTDDEHPLGTLKEGQTFGEYSMLTGNPGVYTVIAFSDMLLMRIGQDDFPKFIELNASNASEIMRNMANMIHVLKINIDMLRGESSH